jgi:acetyl-CoA carboxylase carboxyl transferase subunit beta
MMRRTREGAAMPPDGWFRRKSKFPLAPAVESAAAVPDGVAIKCAQCHQIIFTKDFEKNLKVCTHCGFHHKLTVSERIAYTVDEGSWQPLHTGLRSVDPLNFKDYQGKLTSLEATTGMRDGMEIGLAAVQGLPLVLGISDFRFIGGSMGSVAGEKVARAWKKALPGDCP